MSTDADIAWAAGIFEGEGCVSPRMQGSGRGGALVVRMTDLDVIERYVAILGVGTIRGPLATYAAHHKPSWEWRVTKWGDIVAIRDAFEPWLGERRRARFADLVPVGLKGREGQTRCLRGHALVGPDADVLVTTNTTTGYRRTTCRACRRKAAA